jgi:cell fate regulator YaaT (PSP1 superfamily)
MDIEETSWEDIQTKEDAARHYRYRLRFREGGLIVGAHCDENSYCRDQVVMVAAPHGLEPAVVVGMAPMRCPVGDMTKPDYSLMRLATADECEQYENLVRQEDEAFQICRELVEKHELEMRLVRVERFFSGAKIIFYFTADNRVDFRGLVKDLVREFRTRVEMRQVGVRHETKMLGGLGACGRELCCVSFMNNFDSVTIKMVKEQDLPLNPAKISGLCNRLLCCLEHEYETYRQLRKNMPKVGKRIKLGGELVRVKSQNPLRELIVVQGEDGREQQLGRDQWQDCEREPARPEKPIKKEKPVDKPKKAEDDDMPLSH